MDNSDLELSYCEGYFKDLVRLYQDYLGLYINIRFVNGEQIISDNSQGRLCKLLRERYPDLCKESRQNYISYPLCRAGILSYNYPINLSDKNVGTICIGQKLISGKENISQNIFVEALDHSGANPVEIEYFLNLFNELDKIDLDSGHDIKNKIDFIKKHFYIEFNRSYYTEKRVNDLKHLAENLAHQFITPIQGIVGNAENLINEYEALPRTCQDVEIKSMSNDIFIEIQKLALCADNLRNWIASEHNWLYKYDFRVASILPILMDTIKLFRNEAKSRGIIIKDPEFAESAPPHLKISVEHMKRVFYNIISNAVKYSYEGSPANHRWIEIKCRKIFDYYCFDIVNYGVGILPEEIDDTIYQTGYRGKLAKDRNRYGSGLGLGVVKKIVEDHGGKVKITSDVQGDGSYGANNPFKTTVRICLPLLKEVDSIGRD